MGNPHPTRGKLRTITHASNNRLLGDIESLGTMDAPWLTMTMMQPTFTSLSLAVTTHHALLLIVAGGLFLLLVLFMSGRHLVSRKLALLIESIRQAKQNLDRDHTLRLLANARAILNTWDWLLSESDQDAVKRVAEQVNIVYST